MKLPACTKTYGSRKVLDFPGMEVETGKIYAVIGSNGSGKSTLGKILSGLLTDDRKVRFPDKNTVGYMPQTSFAFRMSTRKNILLGCSDQARAEMLMTRLQLQDFSDKRADRLSGGETARMALARLMIRSFDLVILDEPTAAMDMETSLLAEDVISTYVKETGCALLLITHSLQQAKRLSDQVLFLHKGTVKEAGPSDQLLVNPKTPELQQFLRFYGGL